MGHVARPLHILLAEIEGRIWFNIVCLKLYQFKRIDWWCLFVLEPALEYVMLDKTLRKVMFSHNLHQAHLQEVGLTPNLKYHETLSIGCHVGLHVNFSFMKYYLNL